MHSNEVNFMFAQDFFSEPSQGMLKLNKLLKLLKMQTIPMHIAGVLNEQCFSKCNKLSTK